jgi:thioesterase domain-containing protein
VRSFGHIAGANALTREFLEWKSEPPQGPYFMLGECFSAPVAYETAQPLRAQGEQVAVLASLDARVPGTTLNRLLGNRLAARVR